VQIDTVLQGLAISCAGMGLVFLALGLLMGAITLMSRTFRPHSRAEAESSPGEADRAERARVAAMAVAILSARENSNPVSTGGWQAVGWDDPSPRQASQRWQAAGR